MLVFALTTTALLISAVSSFIRFRQWLRFCEKISENRKNAAEIIKAVKPARVGRDVYALPKRRDDKREQSSKKRK